MHTASKVVFQQTVNKRITVCESFVTGQTNSLTKTTKMFPELTDEIKSKHEANGIFKVLKTKNALLACNGYKIGFSLSYV